MWTAAIDLLAWRLLLRQSQDDKTVWCLDYWCTCRDAVTMRGVALWVTYNAKIRRNVKYSTLKPFLLIFTLQSKKCWNIELTLGMIFKCWWHSLDIRRMCYISPQGVREEKKITTGVLFSVVDIVMKWYHPTHCTFFMILSIKFWVIDISVLYI